MAEHREGYVVLTLEFEKEGHKWIGRCRELSTSTFASTLDATLSELKELVVLHLNALEDAGECERFLREHGVEFYPKKPKTIERELHIAATGKDCLTQGFGVRIRGNRLHGPAARRMAHV